MRPEVTRHALAWRHATLEQARARAHTLDLKGATFPWRTITGPECSGYWPAGTAAFHINADIADAVLRYVDATDDEQFAREAGVELLVETARMWMSLGHWGRDERFHVFGVTGPDEYSALGDDNVYTNLMMQRNLRGAAGWARVYRESTEPLEVTPDEIERWERAADAVFVPYDEELGVHPQHAGFIDQPQWDFPGTAEEQYPLHSSFPYLQLYRKQVVKQADLVLALFLRGDAFTDEEKARDFDYYERVTVKGTRRSPGAARRSSPPRWGCPTSRTSTSSSPRSRTSATPSTTRPTACTSPRWPVRGSRWSAASAACGTRTRVVLTPSCRSGPRCPRSCRGCATGCCSAAGCCG